MPLNPFGTIKLLILPADLDHMEFWIKAAQLLLSLSILVILHELGHFIPAKLFKTRVEKFYLFFDPKFSLFKFKKGETEYGIGWLPLGGYVKIAGMIDESMDALSGSWGTGIWDSGLCCACRGKNIGRFAYFLECVRTRQRATKTILCASENVLLTSKRPNSRTQ